VEIRAAQLSDKPEIVDLYCRSQAATNLPDPTFIPTSELGNRLYEREAIARYVAIQAGQIIGHGMIENPNKLHLPVWQRGSNGCASPLIELGAAFVDPNFTSQGIWTALLKYRLLAAKELRSKPVSATWSQNSHVKKVFIKNGGFEVGTQQTAGGEVALFVF
jgi:GNAT superfamily N-acetyltransferase